MCFAAPVMDVNVVLEQAATAVQRCLQALQSGATPILQPRTAVAGQRERSHR